MTFLIDQLILIFYNYVNAIRDANKIKNNISINHVSNGLDYAFMIFIIIFITDIYNYEMFILFPISAFFNRQISFDIPLNLKRKLKWDYVSKVASSLIDKIEIRIFGYNGKAPTILYGILFSITIIIELFL